MLLRLLLLLMMMMLTGVKCYAKCCRSFDAQAVNSESSQISGGSGLYIQMFSEEATNNTCTCRMKPDAAKHWARKGKLEASSTSPLATDDGV